ncbi:hypothetical protein WDW89_17495 [Deltaproteobacteria bacterium TL4]
MSALVLGNGNSDSPTTVQSLAWICSAISSQGVGYKDINEDRIVISPEHNVLCVIDGMGGPGEGDKVSQFLAEALVKLTVFNTDSMDRIFQQVSKRIKTECQHQGAGACFLIAKLVKPRLEIWYAGDVKLLLVNKSGKVDYETHDHSLLNEWVALGKISPEGIINHPLRNVVTKALSGEVIDVEYCETKVLSDHQIVIASDGLWDNYTAGECGKLIQGQTHIEAVHTLYKKTLEKMKQLPSENWEGLLFPKPDNLSILVADVL